MEKEIKYANLCIAYINLTHINSCVTTIPLISSQMHRVAVVAVYIVTLPYMVLLPEHGIPFSASFSSCQTMDDTTVLVGS